MSNTKYIELQVAMPSDEIESILNWLADNKYLLYYKEIP